MSSSPLDRSALWTRERAQALSKALSSIMHAGLIPTLTALKKLHPFEWQRSHLFFSFDSHRIREDLSRQNVAVRARTWAHGPLLDECFGKTVSDLPTNHLNRAQARGSLLVWVVVLMSSFHAVLCRLARWRCRFTVLLLQICVSAYMCRIKLPIEGRRAIHTEGRNTPLKGRKQTISC